MDIRYEDDSIIVVRKPAGIESQSGKTFAPDMVSLLKKELYMRTKKPDPYIAVIHRLDRNVEGIMVYAKTKQAAASLSRQVQNHEMKKTYKALLSQKPQKESGKLVDFLVADQKTNYTTVVDEKTTGAQKAILSYIAKPMSDKDPFGELSLTKEEKSRFWVAEIHLVTGRHHQIRVQFANAGMPLWGDCKYNPEFVGRRDVTRVGLCACGLVFRHPVTGKKMEFTIESC